MSVNGYFCVKKETENETVIERSRFISYVKKCETEDDARAFLEEKRKAHPFATHNCYAYITERGKIARFSDDGEPQGTAGQPILEVIKNKKLFDTIVVVTRYFGGIKLGAGGLVRAYSQGARRYRKSRNGGKRSFPRLRRQNALRLLSTLSEIRRQNKKIGRFNRLFGQRYG